MIRQRVAMSFATILCFAVGLASAQDCQPSMGAPAAPSASTVAPAAAPAPSTPATTAPTTTVETPVLGFGRAVGYRGSNSANQYLQALSAMSPLSMVNDLAAHQAAVVQQQQARMAVRRALREPSRARMREQNASRYYAAGIKAESAGNYAAARKYYGRAARIEGSQVSQEAQEALATIQN